MNPFPDVPIPDEIRFGVETLDARGPDGWRGLIDLDDLSMWEPCNCVLGQVTGHYLSDVAKRILGVPETMSPTLEQHKQYEDAMVAGGFVALPFLDRWERDRLRAGQTAYPEDWQAEVRPKYEHLTDVWYDYLVACRAALKA